MMTFNSYPQLRAIVLFVCLIWLPLGCASLKHSIVEPAAVQVESAHSILDLPIYRVDIRGYRMHEALQALSQAIEQTSQSKLHFYYGTSWINQREYFRKYGGPEHWPTPNPFVHVAAVNTTLREVIDSLCREAGWELELTPKGICFLVDARARGTR